MLVAWQQVKGQLKRIQSPGRESNLQLQIFLVRSLMTLIENSIQQLPVYPHLQTFVTTLDIILFSVLAAI